MTQKISKYLQELKNKTGFTHQQISDLSGVPFGTVPKYFSNMDDDAANFEIVRKLVSTMGGSLDELAGIRAPELIVDEEKLTEDGFTESEIKAILRWAGSEISRTYQMVVTGLEERLNERSNSISHRDNLVEEEKKRAQETVQEERGRAQEAIREERRRAKIATIVSYVTLGLFVVLFFMDFLMPAFGWIRR